MSFNEPRNIIDELIHRLRINITDTNTERVAKQDNSTETFTGNGIITTFTLTGDLSTRDKHMVKRFMWVKVNGSTKTMYTDYIPHIVGGYIVFATAPADGAVILINYDKGLTWIYDASSRHDLESKSYPTISVQMVSHVTNDITIGATVVQGRMICSCIIKSTARKEVFDLAEEIRQYFLQHRKTLYYIPFVREFTSGPVMPDSFDPNEHVYRGNLDFVIRPIVEEIP